MRKIAGTFLIAAALCIAASSAFAGKTSQGSMPDVIAQADTGVAIAGMGTTTGKQYAVDLRRCATMSGAEKASCVSFAKRRHGDM